MTISERNAMLHELREVMQHAERLRLMLECEDDATTGEIPCIPAQREPDAPVRRRREPQQTEVAPAAIDDLRTTPHEASDPLPTPWQWQGWSVATDAVKMSVRGNYVHVELAPDRSGAAIPLTVLQMLMKRAANSQKSGTIG